MEFQIEKYSPVIYKDWIIGEKARKGVNIKRLNILTENELKIWDESVPYQDQRNDPGHGEITAYFALKLLNYMQGNRKIAVPAAILHDTGWYGNDPKAWKRLVDANRNNLKALEIEANRRPHQNRGILIAGRILEKTDYFKRNPFPDCLEIADIIGDHDTRKLPASNNGRIVRIADLIWRVTYPHSQIYMANEGFEEIYKRVKETCLSKELLPCLGEIGEKITRIEFVNTICFKFPKKAQKLLEKDFGEELILAEVISNK